MTVARLVIGGRLTEVARAGQWLAQQTAALPRAIQYAMALCLEEALTNVVLHAFTPGAVHDVEIALTREDGEMTLTIADDGYPFDPLTVAPPRMAASLDEAPVGGQGIHLIRTFADSLHYERQDGLNRFTMSFRLGGGV